MFNQLLKYDIDDLINFAFVFINIIVSITCSSPNSMFNY